MLRAKSFSQILHECCSPVVQDTTLYLDLGALKDTEMHKNMYKARIFVTEQDCAAVLCTILYKLWLHSNANKNL